MQPEEITRIILKKIQPLGIILFGSRVRKESQTGDYDIGIIHKDHEEPDLEVPDDWDLFLWTESHWNEGFALQVELARYAKVLYDPEKRIAERFSMIEEHILPHWAGYLKRIS